MSEVISEVEFHFGMVLKELRAENQEVGNESVVI